MSLDIPILAAQVRMRLTDCMIADQARFTARLDGLLRRPGDGAAARAVEALAADVDRSITVREARDRSAPSVRYPADLPVVARRDEIARAIRDHAVVIVSGQTGSGKTTQLPKICLELGRGRAGSIGHTQPRRIAARSVATRIAEELGTPLGSAVGYKVRFGDKTGAQTLIKVMTDGILLAETQHDRLFEQYDTLIIDEAHERSLNIDFLLGYIARILPRRPDLKVIITSATIDPGRFARHFGRPGAPAPVIEVSGRTYPVEIRYRPGPEDHDDRDIDAEIVDAVDELARLDPPGNPGDILVFLSGEREIREAAEALRQHHPPGTEIVPLFARLSASDQAKVFQSHRGRRIVLATNVAETSLTVPGIRYVVDTGLARISRYAARSRIQRLPIEPISRASAQQRSGRCGRLSPGVCIRLFSETDFNDRPEFTDPEIVRTNLASVILQMKALGLGDVEDFPFIEPPDTRMVRDGYETLHELGAVDTRRNLTRLGAEIARLPLDPRIGRMILAADAGGCLAEVLIIASALCIQDPRDRPLERQDQADAAHAEFRDPESDFLGYLRLWRAWHDRARHLSQSKLRRWCADHFISFMRMREWHDIHQQLHAQLSEMGRRPNPKPAVADQIHSALLTGLLTSVGCKSETADYRAPRGSRFHIFPGSTLFKAGPKWVVAAELVQTTRLYARTCAKIQPQWIERLASHLVERTYSEPFWREDLRQAGAYERVTLFGLELAARRLVNYGPIDPAASRDLFIHHALVEPLLAPLADVTPQGSRRAPGRGATDTTGAPFKQHNRALVAQVRALEAKSRNPGLLADAQAIHEFFAARLAPDVWSPESFDRWRRRAEREDPGVLFLTPQVLMPSEPAAATPELYPDAVRVGSELLHAEYRFDPGGPADGITLTVPAEAVGQVDPARTDWLVPGMAVDKIVELVRALPKSFRRNFGPAAAFAERLLAAHPFGEGDLLAAVAAQIQKETGVVVPREAWDQSALPPHLKMNFRVVDSAGDMLAIGRDLPALRDRIGAEIDRRLAGLSGSPWVRSGLREWDFGDLPEQVSVRVSGHRLPAFPSLAEAGDRADLRLFGSSAAAAASMPDGLRRLFMVRCCIDLEHHTKGLPTLDRLAVLFAPVGKPADLRRDLLALIAERAYLAEGVNIRTASDFEARVKAGTSRLSAATREVAELLTEILSRHQRLAVMLAEKHPPAWGAAVADMRTQVARLVYPGFVRATPWDWLRHFPRYIEAVAKRFAKLQAAADRDARLAAQVQTRWAAYRERAERLPVHPPSLVQYRWLLEEFRVSLFAQELRTAVPVSEKRLDELWQSVPMG